jgi:formyltetrahydrofolate hydrolase
MKKEDEKHKNEELIILREHKKDNCVFALMMTITIKAFKLQVACVQSNFCIFFGLF